MKRDGIYMSYYIYVIMQYMYLFSWLHLLRGPRNCNKTAEEVETPSTKILVSKFHSPPKGSRFFLRHQGLDMRKNKQTNKQTRIWATLLWSWRVKKCWENKESNWSGPQTEGKVTSSRNVSLLHPSHLEMFVDEKGPWLWLVLLVVALFAVEVGGFLGKTVSALVVEKLLVELSLSATFKSLSFPSIVQGRTTDNMQVRGWAAGFQPRTSPTWLPSRSLQRVSLQPLGPEIETQTQRTSVWTLRRGWGAWWNERLGPTHVHSTLGPPGKRPQHTAVHDIGSQRGHAAQHRGGCLALHGDLHEKQTPKKGDVWIHRPDSLCFTAGTKTAL